MKITETKVTKIQITDVKSLDPVNVILEDFNRGQGKITIECSGEAWTSYWSAMGEENNIDKFFSDCDNQYLAKKLAPFLESDLPSEDKLPAHAMKCIMEKRKILEITKKKARELYDIINRDSLCKEDHDILYEIYGDEFWYSLPTEPNPNYLYLCRIIDTVREALKTRLKNKE